MKFEKCGCDNPLHFNRSCSWLAFALAMVIESAPDGAAAQAGAAAPPPPAGQPSPTADAKPAAPQPDQPKPPEQKSPPAKPASPPQPVQPSTAAATPASAPSTPPQPDSPSPAAAPAAKSAQPPSPATAAAHASKVAPSPTPAIAADKSEQPSSDKEQLNGYQVPGEIDPFQAAPRLCATNYPAGVLPFGDPPVGPRARVSAELGVSTKNRDDDKNFWLSPVLRARYRVASTLEIAADWGLSFLQFARDGGDSHSQFRVGNPFLAFYSVRRHGCTELRIGLGATVPLASLPKGDQYDAFDAYYGAMAIRGMWEWWLWQPDAITVALPVSWETVINDQWIWGGTVAIAGSSLYRRSVAQAAFDFLIPNEPRRSNLVVPMSVHVGYRVGPVLFGSFVQSIFVVTGKGDKQLSIVPFAKLGLGEKAHVDARMTIAIDKPLGPSFSSKGYWGLSVGGGYEF
jgi:hypothetical protein